MRMLITILFLVISSTLSAQIDILNYYLTKPDTNILYTNFRNVLHFENCCDSNMTLIFKRDTIDISGHGRTVNVHPLKSDTLLTLNILKGNELVFSKDFKILRASSPVAKIGNYSDSVLTKEQILADPVINIEVPNTLIRDFYFLSYYNATYYSDLGDTLGYYHCPGNWLTEPQKEMIKMSLPNDYIIFKVIVGCPDCTFLSLGPLKIIIKE